ncbi:hypothetical protein [Flavivirga spongiicola]|uniref:TonB-dependent receptor plug domain-containing protein n=1 Tax=Flavivirga spongiicola TaxID=421621 RepID=A0ABU7XZL7_9FLAO|nr:hypothetical protein [Flavivirga sp. MEBiC05379]MDO5980401.1 hypothetical protein [Flavivirga sp. MEBiC05379]
MQKYFSIIIVFFFSNIYLTSGQTLLNEDQTAIYNKIPQEKIFVHYNASLLFSGDYFFYKIYNINSQTKELSDLSKMAYIELIGVDKNFVFKHKISLESGVGQGDFFIPTSVPTGNYKLIAYTQWMKNVGNRYFFQSDVSIINPFLKNQNSIHIKAPNSITNETYHSSENKIDNTNKHIHLDINARNFSKREKVILNIKTLMNEALFGSYSISVRKKDSITTPNQPSANSFEHIYSNIIKSKTLSDKKPIYLPELRGELISGTVFMKNTNENIPYKTVSMSISGKKPVFKTSTTSSSGTFYFNLDKTYEVLNANLQVIDEEHENYKIKINQYPPVNYDGLVFSDFKISSEMKELITEHSINNQIENAYYNVKKHKTKQKESIIPFYSGQETVYNLDDYTRFKSVKETIVEIVNKVWIEEKKGVSTFRLRNENPNDKNLPILVITDGLLVLNHDDLVSYDARKIKTISVINTKYKYGGHTFKGIISVETFKGDFNNNISGNYTKSITLIRPQDNKDYFNQEYDDTKSLKRIPDYRSQLLWNPNLTINKKDNTVTFYTSDYVGDYQISIEGFTKGGIPISLKETISVK